MPVQTTSDIDTIESVEDAQGSDVPVANDGSYSVSASGVSVDAAGALVTLDTHGKGIIDVGVEADGGSSARYGIEASPDGETWFGPTVLSDSGVEEWFTTLSNATRVVRLVVVDPAAGGTTATVYMEAS